MKLPFRILIYITVISGVVGTACLYWPRTFPTEPPAGGVNTVSGRLIKPTPVRNERAAAASFLNKRALPLLKSGGYRELDEMAASLRKSAAEFPDGIWELQLFYMAVADPEDGGPESAWQERHELVRKWFEEDPESITARVAMARFLYDYAAEARGGGWAHTVTTEGWRLMHERTTEALRILEAARTLPEKCPVWYSTWTRVAQLAEAPRDRYEEIVDEGLKAFPGYNSLYFTKAYYLQERWYGKPGEWQEFARRAADERGGEAGDVLYAQIVWSLHNLRIFGNPIRESGAEWARIERGFEALRRKYPDSIYVLSEYCAISGFAPTMARSRQRGLFSVVGNKVDLMVWKKMENFDRNRAWALSSR